MPEQKAGLTEEPRERRLATLPGEHLPLEPAKRNLVNAAWEKAGACPVRCRPRSRLCAGACSKEDPAQEGSVDLSGMYVLPVRPIPARYVCPKTVNRAHCRIVADHHLPGARASGAWLERVRLPSVSRAVCRECASNVKCAAGVWAPSACRTLPPPLRDTHCLTPHGILKLGRAPSGPRCGPPCSSCKGAGAVGGPLRGHTATGADPRQQLGAAHLRLSSAGRRKISLRGHLTVGN